MSPVGVVWVLTSALDGLGTAKDQNEWICGVIFEGKSSQNTAQSLLAGFGCRECNDGLVLRQ